MDVTGVNGGPLLVESEEYSYRVTKSYSNNENDENNHESDSGHQNNED